MSFTWLDANDFWRLRSAVLGHREGNDFYMIYPFSTWTIVALYSFPCFVTLSNVRHLNIHLSYCYPFPHTHYLLLDFTPYSFWFQLDLEVRNSPRFFLSLRAWEIQTIYFWIDFCFQLQKDDMVLHSSALILFLVKIYKYFG